MNGGGGGGGYAVMGNGDAADDEEVMAGRDDYGVGVALGRSCGSRRSCANRAAGNVARSYSMIPFYHSFPRFFL